MDDFNFENLFRAYPQLPYLYKVHPHFDRYPQYLKDGLLANERLQGRLKPNI